MILIGLALAGEFEVETPEQTTLEYALSLQVPGLAERLNPHLDPPEASSQDFVDGYAAGVEDALQRPLRGAAVGSAVAGCVAGTTCLVGLWAPCVVWPLAFAGSEAVALRMPTTLGHSDSPPDWVLGWEAGYTAELQRRRARTVAMGASVGLGLSALGYGALVVTSN